jgi:hypothetical protein
MGVHLCERSTMHHSMTRGARRARVALMAAGLLLAWPMRAVAAQPTVRAEDVTVGSEAERYLRTLSTLRDRDPVDWGIRGAGRVRAGALGVAGPWPVDTTRRRVSLRGADAALQVNTSLPTLRDDGAAWSGRGLNARATGMMSGAWGIVSFRLAPVLWWAQNVPVRLVPGANAPNPYVDPQRPRTIDLPQVMGDGAVARLDPGESYLALTVRGARLALTSAAAQLGAGTHHSLILQGDGGGYPRLEAGLLDGWRTPLGVLNGQLAWGRLAQTPWAPLRRTGSRFGSHIVGTWRPPRGDRVEFGLVRFYHRDWFGIRARDLKVPFGSFFHDAQIAGEDDPDNQLAMLFGRVRVPEAGLEFFGEFGKNDRSVDSRDLLVELEHNSAWLAGFQKVWRGEEQRLWSVSATAASGRIPALIRLRPQASYYDHFPIRQGHTIRGQLLGTPLMEREGGAEVRVDRYTPGGRSAVILTTRALPNVREEAVPEDLVRQEWAAYVERLQFTAHGTWFARVGAIADMGRWPDVGDGYNVSMTFGYSLRK